jgi:hypothetical protein
MFDRMVVQEALKCTWALDGNPGWILGNPVYNQDCVTSQLIYDIFGGEILKTHLKNGWHFYNRINGERIDFTKSEKRKSIGDIYFEDLPSTPDETHNYFDQEDYSIFLMSFIRTFEEAVGLKKYQADFAA